MRKTLPVVLILTFVIAVSMCLSRIGASPAVVVANGASGSQLDQELVNRSKQVWEAYKTKNVANIKTLTAEDYGSFTLAGPSNLQQDIATIDKLTIENYTLEDPKVTKTTKDVAILRYKCDLKGSMEGKTFRPVLAENTIAKTLYLNSGFKERTANLQKRL